MVRALAIAVVALVPLVAAPLAAQNLVVNPHFHTGDFGWEVYVEPLDIAWNGTFDSNGESCSGVLAATMPPWPEAISTLAGQCITGVSELISYDFGVDLLVPLGEPGGSFSGMRVDWYSEIGCSGDYLGSAGPGAGVPPPDTWVTMEAFGITPPVGANSVKFLIIMGRAIGGDGESYSAIFDDAYLAVTGTYENLIFADGVESGDTGCWDVTVP